MESQVTCICESVYRNALTRGRKYATIEKKDGLVKITGDNGRTRWFSSYCFDLQGECATTMTSFKLDDPIEDASKYAVEVTVTLSDGQRRWCLFTTPSVLASCGELLEDTQVRFHYCNTHLIVATEISEILVKRILKEIDAQGDLISCTVPLDPIEFEAEFRDRPENRTLNPPQS